MTHSIEVIGGYTKGAWQSLDGAELTDLDAISAQDVASRAFREELSLITNAENLVVLAGLGTSLGIVNERVTDKLAPKMSDLWAEVEKLGSYTAIKAQLSDELVQGQNFEHILSDAQARLVLNPRDTALADFVREAEDVVWKSCSFIDDHSQVESHELLLRKVARRSTRLQRTQLFSTNYDLAFELAARRARFNVIDGFGYGGQDFDGGSFDLDYVRRRPHEPLALEPSVFHLLKLHGSVDWDATDGGVRKVPGFAKPTSPVLIYPSSAKYQMSYQQPYLEFMSRFQIALRQPDVGLIVVGFGFNDEHLVAPIEAALRSNIGLRAVVVTPGARDATRSKTLGWIEALIERGDRRLSLLNGTYDDLVRFLPDMPARDERDAHADRVSLDGNSRA
ncbi:hypothetical protein RL72_01607 [Microbacterium azadirachtae]|uniref:Uncharacterized protein n=1 Tax=Microbacterium azadirachtae TaxID=582680 RepID=A0A0F0KWP4_9MICO|nr:SIR2 family protein [Microbacterium azadirachtae]KJL24884.1 hypothetical protein RL72_01607 [Microbacterium azadirachtae]